MAGETIRVYSDGNKRSTEPFNGWRYFTEYAETETGVSISSGINQVLIKSDRVKNVKEEGS